MQFLSVCCYSLSPFAGPDSVLGSGDLAASPQGPTEGDRRGSDGPGAQFKCSTHGALGMGLTLLGGCELLQRLPHGVLHLRDTGSSRRAVSAAGLGSLECIRGPGCARLCASLSLPKRLPFVSSPGRQPLGGTRGEMLGTHVDIRPINHRNGFADKLQ